MAYCILERGASERRGESVKSGSRARLSALVSMSCSNSRLKEFSSTFPLRTLILCSALVFRIHVHGEVLVIGSNLPIMAAPGDDVILPCHLEPMFDVRGLTVEWSKPDLKPDPSDPLSRVEYVHLYRDRKEVPDMKLASSFRRTELFTDHLKHGNISLKLLNVSEEDSGRYRCFIPKLRSSVKAAIVQLRVDPNFTKASTTETPLLPTNFQTPDPQDVIPAGRSRVSVVLVVVAFMSLVSLLSFAAYFCHRLRLRLNKDRDDETQKQPLTVSEVAPLQITASQEVSISVDVSASARVERCG